MDAGSLTKKFFDAFTRRDLEAMASTLDDSVSCVMPGGVPPMSTREEVLAMYRTIFDAIGDAQQEVFDLVAEGNMVAFTVSAPGGDGPAAAIVHRWSDDEKLLSYRAYANMAPPGLDD